MVPGAGGGEVGRRDAVGDDAVAAEVLGAVEGRVGQLDQLDGVARVVGVGGDADADGDAERLFRLVGGAARASRTIECPWSWSGRISGTAAPGYTRGLVTGTRI